MPLTLAEALSGLGRQVSGYLARQQTLSGRFDTGAFIRADWNADDPGGTAGLVALSLWLHLVRRKHPDLVSAEPDDATLRKRSLLALDYLTRAQRPSGLTDLRDCNYDSSPDAGFILQAILPPLYLAKKEPPADDWSDVVSRLTEFGRKLTEGARTGGFHTPNHRWVIAGALQLAEPLFPEIPVGPTIEAYLAEGIDLDEDGFYIERSAGVYDAICAKSLFLLAERPGYYFDLKRAVERNLLSNLSLLNPDGTIETGLSRRQDAGTAPLASNLAVPYLLAHFRANPDHENGLFAGVAQWLWDLTPSDRRDYYGMSQTLLAHGEPTWVDPTPYTSRARYFAQNGLWRLQREVWTASAFRDHSRLLNFRYGAAFLAGVSIHQSYFGVGQFIAEEMVFTNPTQDAIALRSSGTRHPYRPGYEQPLGRPVAPEKWAETKAEREIRRVPPATSELIVEPWAEGLFLRFSTLDGLDRATTQIAFDFPAGGVWETDDTCFEPVAGQIIFLRDGYGKMRYGNDVISISPGHETHRMTKMRDAEPPAPGLVRVLMTFETPVDYMITITGGTWPNL
jgi:hypothetical protein